MSLEISREGDGRASPRVAAEATGGKHGFEKPTAPVVREVDIPKTSA